MRRGGIPACKVIRSFVQTSEKVTNPPHPRDKTSFVVFVCGSKHLRQHGILPSPGHADAEQVVHRGGILQTGLAGLGLVRQTADHAFCTGLERQRREMTVALTV